MTSTNEYRGLTGTEFGRYRLDELIDRGGVGEVYRAFDSKQDRHVALKILAPKYAADDDFRERFRRESQLVAGMKNPHIVPIHDFGENDGRLYLDMRLIDGRDLGTVIREDGAMSPQRAVGIVTQVASALQAAHGQGIVHRDVKPTNVLTAPTEVSGPFVYLADFGLARTVGGSGATRITVGDGTDGTLEYMAPERFGSGPIDWRVDIYSLGCVLFECLTGRPAFPAAGIYETMNAHVTAPIPRVSEHAPGIPTALDDVVTKAMAKRPEDRYETAGAFASACEEALAATGATIPEPRTPDSSRQSDSSTKDPSRTDTSKDALTDSGASAGSSSTPTTGAGSGIPTQQRTAEFGQQSPPSWVMTPPSTGYPPPTNSGPGYPPPAGVPPYTNSWPAQAYQPPRKTRWWIPVVVILSVLVLLFVLLAIIGAVADSSGPSANPGTSTATPSAEAPQTTAAAPATTPISTSYTLTQMFSVAPNGNCVQQSTNLYPQEEQELQCSPASGGVTLYASQYSGGTDTYVQGVAARYTTFNPDFHSDCVDTYAATGTDTNGKATNAYFTVYKHSPFSVMLVSDTESLDQLSQTQLWNANPQALCSGG